jgi:hypothetical protein
VLPAALLDDRFERPCSINNLLDGDTEEAIFLVQGSAPSPYKVVFVKEGKNLTATCTCPAGQNGQYCKHRFAILEGRIDGIVSSNSERVKKVVSWLPGTDVEKALGEVRAAERRAAEANKELSRLKKTLARTMRD